MEILTKEEVEEKELWEKTRKALEWNELLSRVSRFSLSESGQTECLNLSPCKEKEEAELLLRETSQMLGMVKKNHPFSSFPDFGKTLFRVEKFGVPEITEFLEVLYGIKLARSVKNFLSDLADVPDICASASGIVELRELEREIERVISQKGEVLENATPFYKELCLKEKRLKNRLEKKVDTLLKSANIKKYLQDDYATIRDDRFVFPVKADFKGKIRGIIHSYSSSGATIFLEPEELIELNNGWKVAEEEKGRERIKILSNLAKRVAEDAAPCRENLEILIKFDCIYAKAKFSEAVEGISPSINCEGEVDLNNAKHPLLVLNGKEVVGNPFLLKKQIGTLVISGANTGGKTVTIKMIGLFALMVRTGMLIPAQAGGNMAFFSQVFADIGDPQKLKDNISSFSGHLLNIAGIMRCAQPGSLVLFDELVNSTDPNQGAALAIAILKSLNRKKIKTLVTTHYPSLKILGQTEEDFENISVVFDEENLSPTYILKFGFPGSSYAVTIARRLGVLDEVLSEAERILEGDTQVEEPQMKYNALAELESKSGSLELEIKKVKEELLEIKQEKNKQKAITESLIKEEKIFLNNKKSKMDSEINKARQCLVELMENVKKAPESKNIKKAITELKNIEVESWEESLSFSKKPLDEARAGDLVYVPALMREAVLLEDWGNKKKVKIRVKKQTLLLDKSTLKWASKNKPPSAKLPSKDDKKFTFSHSSAEVEPSCTLRGLRVGEVEDILLSYLDKAMLSGIDRVSLIHGQGSGALKKVVRKILSDSIYVKSFHSPEPHEGGDGVTVVILKYNA